MREVLEVQQVSAQLSEINQTQLTHHLVGGGTDPVGVRGDGAGLRWRRYTGSVPRFGDGPRSRK